MPQRTFNLSHSRQGKLWTPGVAPVAVVMISLNEAHNMAAVLSNLSGWAREVYLVDSYSTDNTVDIALSHGAHVVQRRFRGFGDQWNFALRELPVTSPWTMKLDPDERLTEQLKAAIIGRISAADCSGISFDRRLWFMGRQLPVRQRIVRVWVSGKCRFSDVQVNEHPMIDGKVCWVDGDLEHHDSPDLEHWIEKQNRYTTAEALIAHQKMALSATPRLLGSGLQRRLWLKQNFHKLPFRYLLLFFYHWLFEGAWRAGWVGYAWARLRADVMRLIEYKRREMEVTGRLPSPRAASTGQPHPRVRDFE